MKKNTLIAAIMMISLAAQAQVLTSNFAISDTTPCQGDYITITPLATGDIAVWQWSLLGCNPDTRYTYSSTESAFQVQVVADQPFQLTLIVLDDEGNSSIQAIMLNITGKPVTTVTSNVNRIICQNTPVTLTASGASTYTWLQDGDTIAAHADSVIIVNGEGDYAVIGEANGCTYPPQSIKITAEETPSAQPTFTFWLIADPIINNSVHLCSSGSYVDLEENVTSQYPVSAMWSNGVSGFSSGPVTVGTYQCVLTSDETGCVYPLDAISILADLPSLMSPQVKVQSNLLIARVPYTVETYQWYMGSGAVIQGATAASYHPSVSGKYYVRVSSGACFANSNVVRFIGQQKEMPELLSAADLIGFEIFELTGKKIEANADDLPSGLYIIRAQFSDGSSDSKEVAKLSGTPLNISDLFKY